jgi:hypothetical protein
MSAGATGGKWSNGAYVPAWNQLKANKDKFKIDSSYNENEYTTEVNPALFNDPANRKWVNQQIHVKSSPYFRRTLCIKT